MRDQNLRHYATQKKLTPHEANLVIHSMLVTHTNNFNHHRENFHRENFQVSRQEALRNANYTKNLLPVVGMLIKPYDQYVTSGIFSDDPHYKTVFDFGCGLGLYVRDMRAAGMTAVGVDGNPATVGLTAGRCMTADLTKKVDLGSTYDVVFSFEVAEHIPPEKENIFIANLHRHVGKTLIMSWGNQAGSGHINNQPEDEVIPKLTGPPWNLKFDYDATVRLRSEAFLEWFKQTVFVFHKRDPVLRYEETLRRELDRTRDVLYTMGGSLHR